MTSGFKSVLISLCFLFLCMGMIVSSASAAIVNIQTPTATLLFDDTENQLMGATGVVVVDADDNYLGTYDVHFVEGTAGDLFGTGTYGPFDFGDVTSRLLAIRMADALFEQVLIDVDDDHQFDSFPALTNGITTLHIGDIYTAYDKVDNRTVSVITNRNRDSYDERNIGSGLSSTFDTALSSQAVFAVWNESSAVPVPGSLLILGSGLMGMAAIRRR